MLVKNSKSPLKSGNYVGIKFINGEEILCKLGEVDDVNVELIRPHYLVGAEGGMAFMPWPSLVEHEDVEKHTLVVERSKILVGYELREDFRSQMLIMYGDQPRIIVPEKKIIGA